MLSRPAILLNDKRILMSHSVSFLLSRNTSYVVSIYLSHVEKKLCIAEMYKMPVAQWKIIESGKVKRVRTTIIFVDD